MTPHELELLIRTHHRSLELFASQWTPSPQDSVQEAFLKLFASDETIDNPKAWLFRVVRNLAIDAGRSESSRKQRERSFTDDRPKFESHSDSAISPTELQSALEKLPADQREVIVARIWGKLTLEEIGTALNIATSTAHRRYKLGIQQLKSNFEMPCQTKKNH